MTQDLYSDEALREQAKSEFPGTWRVAQALLTVPVEVRDQIASEARTMMHLSPGWRWSSAVETIIGKYNRGEPIDTYRKEGRAKAEKDNKRFGFLGY